MMIAKSKTCNCNAGMGKEIVIAVAASVMASLIVWLITHNDQVVARQVRGVRNGI